MTPLATATPQAVIEIFTAIYLVWLSASSTSGTLGTLVFKGQRILR